MERICVFCGSSPGSRPAFRDAADHLGRLLAHRDLELIYGGGHTGLMGVVADAVLEAGGRVTGVIPRALVAREKAHHGVTELEIVGSMHERKSRLSGLGDAFVALPGGLGTLEEIAEALTWSQLGLHRKPCGLLNVAGFFDPLIRFLDRATRQGFVTEENREMVLVSETAEDLLDRFARHEPPDVPRWIREDEI